MFPLLFLEEIAEAYSENWRQARFCSEPFNGKKRVVLGGERMPG